MIRDDVATLGERVLADSDIRRVRAVLYLNGLRGPDVDDATQEVLARLLEQGSHGIDNVGAWACAVATRLAMDQHRRRRSRQNVTRRLHLQRSHVHDDPDVAVRESVRAALARLDVDLRATVVLRYYGDLSVAEIAKLLAVPEGTVKSRLNRASGVLRELLKEDS
jgi:RNA polymerase sigma-70 factor (ECF subfamily)